MNFASRFADIEASVVAAGFQPTMWSPEFGWHCEEAKLAQDPFQPQLLAAFQTFLWMFGAARKAWIHLVAEMQAGKTGVITALIRLMLKNHGRIGIRPENIFVITGMSDTAWVKQTRERLPMAVRKNVHHNPNLSKVCSSLRILAAGDYLKNVLVVLDESHLACKYNNQPAQQVFRTMLELCPIELWAENNVRLITISATDPAAVIGVAEHRTLAQQVNLYTTEDYQSVESLHASGRIINTFNLNGLADVQRLLGYLDRFDGPRYHILRPQPSKNAKVKAWLEEAMPDCQVIQWDTKANERRRKEDDASSTLSSVEDINEVLEVAPERHTFILLKNMFYASKTVDDSHVGILYDRVSTKDDTNLQSLLGRACGYDKNSTTLVFTSMQTVDNYLKFWRDICPRDSMVFDVEARRLKGKMPCVTATAGAGGAGLGVEAVRAFPVQAMGGAGGPDPAPKKARETAVEENFTSEWREFPTFEAAKAWSPRIRAKAMVDGFYTCVTTKHAEKQRYDAIMVMKGGKKTATMPWGAMKVGEKCDRLYVGYRDEHDPTTAVFVVRRLTRIA
jgi:hypothetical protein